VSGCHFEELDGKTWTAPDEMASENEVGDFLYGVVRLLKPRIILETGYYRGASTRRLAEGIVANGHGGWVQSCDTDASIFNGKDRINGNRFTVFNRTGEWLASMVADVDLAFLDSSGDRLAEAKALRMKPWGIVVLHDARRPVKEAIEKELGWKSIFIPTPRGLAIFQA
jgi:predicted O-methyltransferase YrrM